MGDFTRDSTPETGPNQCLSRCATIYEASETTGVVDESDLADKDKVKNPFD